MDLSKLKSKYEVVGISSIDKESSRYETFDYENAMFVYDGFKNANIIKDGIDINKRFITVLFCKTTPMISKGSIELEY